MKETKIRTLVHGLLCLLKTLLKLHVGRLNLQSGFIDINGRRVATKAEESSGLSTIALAPVSLQLDGLLTILKGFGILL